MIHEQIEKVSAFKRLHSSSSKLLILPNAWDVGSAKAMQNCGFESIGTTSAGIAYSKGFADGERISFEDMLSSVRAIVESVDVPVTVDMENGYSNDLTIVGENVRRIMNTGAVGINIEDGDPSRLKLEDVIIQAKKIEAVKRAALSEGIPLFINARIDTYWLKDIEIADRFAGTVDRAKVYIEARADGIFVPNISDLSLMRKLVEMISVPINVLAGIQTPPSHEVAETGVKRISMGSGMYRAIYSYIQQICLELKHEGSIASYLKQAVPYLDMNDQINRGR
ncbi:isocitrate lyase/phosphoenolpyruvate mutase family protein [Paenibacillus sp. CF384]|uniref:isocitrate lyase/PEP mutase family protein n=1 Tax=Paenibacillus sp. CF384 TaxID=1884382 RepID=UPI0008979D12|nr:isocitrate lyase/phosphoenolpyruvate mutase family protein [Paenibacillus sp. CF384]SDW08400.1 2-Methylisocitrate lyase, PEP mutase family [Paenibacillus sp. CF384]